MENTINKQHVQVPNKMTEEHNDLKPGDILVYATIKRHMNKDTKTCFPSLDTISKECGASINTIRSSIQNLINSGYIETEPYGRGKLYRFLKWDKFEPFSYDFLDNKNLSFKEKAYILVTQQYMFKDKDSQDGILTYSNVDLANKINLTPPTISKLNNSLMEKNILSINTTSLKNQETGLPIKEKVFHLTKLQQAIVFILGNHEERIQENTNDISLLKERLDKLEKENKKLKREIENII